MLRNLVFLITIMFMLPCCNEGSGIIDNKTSSTQQTPQSPKNNIDPTPGNQTLTKVRIGSWNLTKTNDSSKDLTKIARVIEDNFDVIAIRGISDQGSLSNLLNKLTGWNYMVSSTVIGTAPFNEYLATIYRSNGFLNNKNYFIELTQVTRKPLVTCLRYLDLTKFCISNSYMTDSNTEYGILNEIYNLNDFIAGIMGISNTGVEKDFIYTGSFMMDHTDVAFNNLRAAGYQLAASSSYNNFIDNGVYSSPRDHIFVNPTTQKQFMPGSYQMIDIVSKYCANDFNSCKTTISAYAPLSITTDLSVGDNTL